MHLLHVQSPERSRGGSRDRAGEEEISLRVAKCQGFFSMESWAETGVFDSTSELVLLFCV